MGTVFNHEKSLRRQMSNAVYVVFEFVCGTDKESGQFSSFIKIDTSALTGLEDFNNFYKKLLKISNNTLSKSEEIIVKTGFMKIGNPAGSPDEFLVRVKNVRANLFSKSEKMIITEMSGTKISDLENYISFLAKTITDFKQFEYKCSKEVPQIRVV